MCVNSREQVLESLLSVHVCVTLATEFNVLVELLREVILKGGRSKMSGIYPQLSGWVGELEGSLPKFDPLDLYMET